MESSSATAIKNPASGKPFNLRLADLRGYLKDIANITQGRGRAKDLESPKNKNEAIKNILNARDQLSKLFLPKVRDQVPELIARNLFKAGENTEPEQALDCLTSIWSIMKGVLRFDQLVDKESWLPNWMSRGSSFRSKTQGSLDEALHQVVLSGSAGNHLTRQPLRDLMVGCCSILDRTIMRVVEDPNASFTPENSHLYRSYNTYGFITDNGERFMGGFTKTKDARTVKQAFVKFLREVNSRFAYCLPSEKYRPGRTILSKYIDQYDLLN